MAEEKDAGRVIREGRLRAADMDSASISPAHPPESNPGPDAPVEPPSARAISPGDLISGRYRIVHFIAHGGMGDVFAAEDIQLHETIALKTVRAEIAREPGVVDRFKRELQLARKITHRNVCRLFDFGTHGDTVFLTMELLQGETLAQRLARAGRMTPEEAFPVAIQMAEGLEAAHKAGIIHRDFKSSNVILQPQDGGGVRAVITDFGLARGTGPEDRFAASVTGTGSVLGTPVYMSPEQVEGSAITPATDLYALGVVLYEMITGVWPFDGDTPLQIAARRLSELPLPPSARVPGVSEFWERTILGCLQRRRQDRFSSAAEVMDSLRGKASSRHTLLRRGIVAALIVTAILLWTWKPRTPSGGDVDSWVVSFADDFERPEPGGNYQVESGTWHIRDGGLEGRGTGSANIDLVPQASGDLRVSFDVRMLPGSGKNEVAVFLVGHRDPSRGYYLAIGGDHEIAEIDRNGIEMVLSPSPSLDLRSSHQVAVERKGNRLEILMDGRSVCRYTDPIPLNPGEYTKVRLGTYDGALRIDNLKLERARVPEMLAPTVPGDLLFDRGEFEEAQAEYEKVARDQEGKTVAAEALFKAGLCMVEQKEYRAAEGTFLRVPSLLASDFYRNLAELDAARSRAAGGDTASAFRMLDALSARKMSGESRFRLANEFLLLAGLVNQAGSHSETIRCYEYVRDHFRDVPILKERAEYMLATVRGTDPDANLQDLQEFLRTKPRIGKNRYVAREYIGALLFLKGDFAGAEEEYREMAREYAGINARFALRGVYGQAMALSASGNADEAARVAARLPGLLPGDPLPERLFAEWDAHRQWLAGDVTGAIQALEAEVREPHGSARSTLTDVEQLQLDQIELAVLLLQNGNSARAAQWLEPLAGDSTEWTGKIAALFLGRISPGDFLEDVSISYDDRRFYLAEFYRARGELQKSREALRFSLDESNRYDALFLSPLLCRLSQP